MRLFIAINFTPEVKGKLSRVIQELNKEALRGNFTKTSNLHLTLAFLGEVSSNRIQDILKVMNQIFKGKNSFEIKIGGLGKFINREELLYWCGIQENETLTKLQNMLIQGLKAYEFTVDDKPFQPHITLGRRCKMGLNFDEKEFAKKIPPINMEVAMIHLMKSENKEGKIIYTSLEEVIL